LIRIFYDNVTYRLKGSRKTLENIEKVIRKEKRISGDLNFVLCRDNEIIAINRKYLKHNYYTDVIAFGYGNEKVLSGEIYISIDTVKQNAINYKVSLKDEVLRVMIHGTLHLCGYEDENENMKSVMRKKEDKWLKEFNNDDGI
jgi:probable rRNA maturation factor